MKLRRLQPATPSWLLVLSLQRLWLVRITRTDPLPQIFLLRRLPQLLSLARNLGRSRSPERALHREHLSKLSHCCRLLVSRIEISSVRWSIC